MARQVTVIGGSGFIGRHVVRCLARQGWVIRVAVRRPDEALYLKTMGDVGQIVPVAANLRDEASLAAAVAGVSAVVNLVGILHESGAQGFAAIHAEGAGRAARLAKAAGAEHFVHVSAIGADPASPSAYARSKAAGEAAVRAAFPEAVILRPSVVFGPEDDFFNRFATLARYLPALPLIGGGKTRFQPVYVGDVAAAVAAVLAAEAGPGPLKGRVFELGGPRIYSFRELMHLVLRQTGRCRALVPVPFALAEWQGRLLGLLPRPPLTRDQVLLLKCHNVATPGVPGLADLGIAPTAVEAVLPTYLKRYRRGG
jgi:NADH dehydrogenase